MLSYLIVHELRFPMTVTTVDSGSRALEFLGLHENDQNNPSTPSVSPKNNQVCFVSFLLKMYEIPPNPLLLFSPTSFMSGFLKFFGFLCFLL